MDNENRLRINTGEIYIEENSNWDDDVEIRHYIQQMETLILGLLRMNKIVAVSSDINDPEYFKTKLLQSEDAQAKALDHSNPPFTYTYVQDSPKWELYSYSEPYIINRGEEDPEIFEFFFAFKLRQSDLLETDDFLQYHSDNSFNKEKNRFVRFLSLILRKYKPLFSSEQLSTVNEWISLNVKESTQKMTDFDDNDRIEWLGTQKQLAELFIELKRKGFITVIDPNQISSAFTKSDTIKQILKPATDNHTLEDTYEQVFTKAYRPRFHNILKCK